MPRPKTASQNPPAACKSTLPPTPMLVDESLRQRGDIEKKLEECKEKAKQEMEKALQWGEDEPIKVADYKWRIVTNASYGSDKEKNEASKLKRKVQQSSR